MSKLGIIFVALGCANFALGCGSQESSPGKGGPSTQTTSGGAGGTGGGASTSSNMASSTTTASSSSSTAAASSSSGGSPCVHDLCQIGAPLTASCSPCAKAVCDADDFCCSNMWDDKCVASAEAKCSISCGSSSASSGAASSSAASSSSSATSSSSSATSSSSSAASSSSGGADPCLGVPPEGQCVSASQAANCVIASGNAQPKLFLTDCASYEQCELGNGFATCELKPGACIPGSEECGGFGLKKVCNAQGQWVQENCEGCKATPLGAVCTGANTVIRSTKFQYEARGPNAGNNGWGDIFVAAASQILVASIHILPDNSSQLIDMTVTAADGSFAIAVPDPPTQSDYVVFFAAHVAPGTSNIDFALAKPDVPDGEWNVNNAVPTLNSTFHSWSAYASDIDPQTPITVSEAHFSGALRVYDYLRYIHDSTAAMQGKPGLPLVIWMRPNTSWSCGACQMPKPTMAAGTPFVSQIVIPATAQDTSYWSDAVTAHELGHWVMGSYGHAADEGGVHCLLTPTLPGQAWSEGWATGWSSYARNDSLYYDKQNGTFFWLDVALLNNSDGFPFPLPNLADGLFQRMEENFVSHMLWGVGSHPADPGQSLVQNAFLLDALASPRMTISPFGRGYTVHWWDQQCPAVNVQDSLVSAPMVADFLDALRCGGMTAAEIDAVTQPYYPYPSQQPICN